jgi:hypothetical protein
MSKFSGWFCLHKKSMVLRTISESFVLVCLLGQAPLHAEGITIEGRQPSLKIDMKIDDEPIGTVLQTLHEKYGIEISGADKLEGNDPISLNLSGNLPAILERLLRNQNYMIVRSPKNQTGVAKIMIAGASHHDASGNPATPPPANNPPMP